MKKLPSAGYSIKLGNYTGAILYYDKALAVDPKHENALYNKGLILRILGNDTGALTYLDKALAINPKDEDALYEKGVFLDKLGNHTTAIEYLDKVLAINPHDVDALNKNLIMEEKTGYHFDTIEQKFKAIKADNVNSSLGSAMDVFFGFDPRTRPVLWCMLITHALLYRRILEPL